MTTDGHTLLAIPSSALGLHLAYADSALSRGGGDTGRRRLYAGLRYQHQETADRAPRRH
jgi:hypothetical protein